MMVTMTKLGRAPSSRRSSGESLEAGRDALRRRRWTRARACFERAAEEAESPEALEGLGLAAWWLDDVSTTFLARERAFALYRGRGDRRSAARVAAWIGWDYNAFRGERAIAHGWLRRAGRLLEGLDPCPEHGWVAVREASLVLPADAGAARRMSSQATRLGAELGSIELQMNALALEGLALVCLGRVEDGMVRLDEATAAAVGGEMEDPVAISFTCCYLIFACERVRDLDRAGQWCRRVDEMSRRWAFRPMSAVCAVHHGTVLTWRGDWADADRELSRATDVLLRTRPALAAEGQVRLAELRRRQGRLREAEELLARAETHPLSALIRAGVALDRGEPAAAADHAHRFMRVASDERRMERAPALELLVRAELALGNRQAAALAARELSAIAALAGTDGLRAAAAHVEGAVARAGGDLDAARRATEDAVTRFELGDAPFEAARARTDLARILADLGRHRDAVREATRALATLDRLGARREASRARAVFGGELAREDLTPREVEVLRLVAGGLDTAAIADRLVVSPHTVRRHMANIRAKLGVSSRAAAVGRAAERGMI